MGAWKLERKVENWKSDITLGAVDFDNQSYEFDGNGNGKGNGSTYLNA
jgi:hypothetical protein